VYSKNIMSCGQQGTDTDYLLRPVQSYARDTDTLDMHMRSGLHGMARLQKHMPPPLNFMGIKRWPRPAPPEERCCVPAGISGVYRYQGPVLEAFGIEPKFQILNQV
jgi:hypothetical protein